MPKESKYPFPILDPQEILQCLNELSIPMSKDDLVNPKPAYVQGIYESLVDLLMGVKIDDLKQPKFDALQLLEHPELHEDALSHVALSSALMRLMAACGLPDFTLQDLLSPTYKRTQRNLSAIINFAKFREEQLANYQALIAETDELNQKKNDMEDENEALASELEEIKQKRESDKPLVENLRAEVQALTAEISALNEQQAGLQQSIRAVKDATTGVADENAKLTFNIQALHQDCSKLQGMIVQSPERKKREVVELNAKLQQHQEDLASKQAQAAATKQRIELLEQAKLDIQKGLSALNYFEEELAKTREQQTKLAQMQQDAQTNQQQLKELAAHEQQLGRQLTMAKERLARLAKQQEEKRAAASKQMEEIRQERRALADKQADNDDKAQKTAAKCGEYEEIIAKERAAHQHEMKEAEAKLSQLREQLRQFNTSILSSFGTVLDTGVSS